MSGRYVSGRLIRNIQSGGKNLAIEYVEKTTSWIRPSGFPSKSVQDDFVTVAQNNVSKFKADTIKIAMKEAAHQSDADTIHHYTAFGINAKGDVIDVKHLYKSN